jgi:hypothetical protein
MKIEETEFDADDGIYTAGDVYGATSDFWGGSEEPEEAADKVAQTATDTVVSD